MSRFSVIPAAAVIDARLSLRELSVLAAIGIHTDRNGWCYPSSERIGEMIGVSGAMVRRSIAELSKCGYVQIIPRRREDGGQTSNAIRVLMDAEHPANHMRLSLEQPGFVTPPVTPEVAAPVTPEVAAPVTPEVARKPPVELSPTETSSPPVKRARGTRLPDDWQPTSDLIEFATSRGLMGPAMEDEVERFRNYWHSKSRDATKLNWPATFRNWVITATKHTAQGAAHGTHDPRSRRPSLVERVHANAQRIIAAERAALGGHDGHPVGADDADVRPPLDLTARRVS